MDSLIQVEGSHLTPLQFKVTQQKLTEKPKTGRFDGFTGSGVYCCIVCKSELFKSEQKYESGCGWPAFFDCLGSQRVAIQRDYQLVGDDLELVKSKPHLVRNEIVCAKCRAHLGHIFDGAKSPTSKRYCVNSASLMFVSDGTNEVLVDEGQEEPDRDIDVCNRD